MFGNILHFKIKNLINYIIEFVFSKLNFFSKLSPVLLVTIATLFAVTLDQGWHIFLPIILTFN